MVNGYFEIALVSSVALASLEPWLLLRKFNEGGFIYSLFVRDQLQQESRSPVFRGRLDGR